jgi:hypothetical protein
VKFALRQIGYGTNEKKNYIRNLPSDIQEKSRDLVSLSNVRVLEDVMEILDRKRHIARVHPLSSCWTERLDVQGVQREDFDGEGIPYRWWYGVEKQSAGEKVFSMKTQGLGILL